MISVARIWVGTSGFSYREWKSSFYPPDLPQRRMLEFYSTRMNTVEIDSTFYRSPTAKLIDTWKESVPEDFRFAIKAPQQITHRQRLSVPSDALTHLTSVVSGLAHQLGLLLFHLPPFLKADAGRLESFLSTVPRSLPTAFEFRHESWFSETIYSILERYGSALCIHDADEGASPLRLTAGATYVRLRRSQYPMELRRQWQERFRGWVASGIEVFAYVKHKDNPDAPRIAMEFVSGT
jgi:uncharacterized protein YecE (DUF72 family)